ncbi:hypothetical protein, partial [Streptomyces brasiliscabiei]|uniref:hypothetical protein n=1 Tax=Streptomyces brasiliscabiei TaxID=2736302 RepID=UPI001C0FE06E
KIQRPTLHKIKIPQQYRRKHHINLKHNKHTKTQKQKPKTKTVRLYYKNILQTEKTCDIHRPVTNTKLRTNHKKSRHQRRHKNKKKKIVLAMPASTHVRITTSAQAARTSDSNTHQTQPTKAKH